MSNLFRITGPNFLDECNICRIKICTSAHSGWTLFAQSAVQWKNDSAGSPCGFHLKTSSSWSASQNQWGAAAFINQKFVLRNLQVNDFQGLFEATCLPDTVTRDEKYSEVKTVTELKSHKLQLYKTCNPVKRERCSLWPALIDTYLNPPLVQRHS